MYNVYPFIWLFIYLFIHLCICLFIYLLINLFPIFPSFPVVKKQWRRACVEKIRYPCGSKSLGPRYVFCISHARIPGATDETPLFLPRVRMEGILHGNLFFERMLCLIKNWYQPPRKEITNIMTMDSDMNAEACPYWNNVFLLIKRSLLISLKCPGTWKPVASSNAWRHCFQKRIHLHNALDPVVCQFHGCYRQGAGWVANICRLGSWTSESWVFSPGDWTGPPDRIRSEEPGQDATKLWISRRAAKTLAGTSLDPL